MTAIILRKRIEGLEELIEINPAQAAMRLDLAAAERVLPNLVYKGRYLRSGNAEWQALDDD